MSFFRRALYTASEVTAYAGLIVSSIAILGLNKCPEPTDPCHDDLFIGNMNALMMSFTGFLLNSSAHLLRCCQYGRGPLDDVARNVIRVQTSTVTTLASIAAVSLDPNLVKIANVVLAGTNLASNITSSFLFRNEGSAGAVQAEARQVEYHSQQRI